MFGKLGQIIGNIIPWRFVGNEDVALWLDAWIRVQCAESKPIFFGIVDELGY
jgi:hypothetical protein